MISNEARQTAAYLLKHQTAAQHAALEEVVLPLLQSLKTRAGYAHLLQRFYGYFKPLEGLIEQQLDETLLPDRKDRRKADFIIHDLTFLKAHVDPLPLATHLPQIKNTYQALGAMYVLEGSTLGGRGITKMLLKNENLNLQPDQVRFFAGYGESTGPMWMDFLKILNHHTTDAVAMEKLVATAKETFNLFKNWLDDKHPTK